MEKYKLYLGDCKNVLRDMLENSIDLVLTDPPYPMLKGGTVLNKAGDRGFGVAPVKNTSKTVGVPWDTSLGWVADAYRVCRLGMMVFCSFHSLSLFQQEISKTGASLVGLITWYKRNSPNPVNNVPRFTTEFIWLFKKNPGLKWRNLGTLYDIPAVPGGCIGKERIKNDDGTTAHPTQKPVKLISDLLACEPESVIDTHMGTGTTGVAAIEKDIYFHGIEINPEYFRIAERRIHEQAEKPKQVDMWTGSNNKNEADFERARVKNRAAS